MIELLYSSDNAKRQFDVNLPYITSKVKSLKKCTHNPVPLVYIKI